MTIHETAAKLSAVNAKIADMAQTSADECIRMAARIEELEGVLTETHNLLQSRFADTKTLESRLALVCMNNIRAILAKGN